MPIIVPAGSTASPVAPTYGLPSLDGQVSLRGLLMGTNTPYRLVGFNAFGLSVNSQDTDRLDGPGAWADNDQLAAKTVPMRVLIRGNSASSWRTLHDELLRAFAPSGQDDVALTFQYAGSQQVLFGRPRVVDPEVTSLGTGLVFASCAFVAQDPRRYSMAENTASTGAPASSGGLTFPLTFPFTIPATFTSGSVQVTNQGNFPTPVTIEVRGQLDDPTVSLVEPDGSPSVLAWDTTVLSGQTLVASSKDRTALIDGVASRIGAMTSRQWFDLPPGTSEIRVGGTGPGLVTIRWRDAWA